MKGEAEPPGAAPAGAEPAEAESVGAGPAGTAFEAQAGSGPDAAAATPVARPAIIPGHVLDEVIDWSRRGYPNEACGMLAGDRFHQSGGAATWFLGLTNEARSPLRYRIEATEQLRAMTAIEDADEELWAIVHSHVRSPAIPSPTDIRQAALPGGSPAFPGTLYLLCSLADMNAPVVRAWRIVGSTVEEIPIEVEP